MLIKAALSRRDDDDSSGGNDPGSAYYKSDRRKHLRGNGGDFACTAQFAESDLWTRYGYPS